MNMHHEIFPLPIIEYPLVIDTLGKHLALGYGIHAYCESKDCRHNARVNLVQLGRRVGRDYDLSAENLKKHFSCSECRMAGRDANNVSFRLHPCTVPHSNVADRRSFLAGGGS